MSSFASVLDTYPTRAKEISLLGCKTLPLYKKSVAPSTNAMLIRIVVRDSKSLVGLGRPVKMVRQNLGDLSSNTMVSLMSTSSSWCVGFSWLLKLCECAAVEGFVGS